MADQTYDVAIIGGGPAGYVAGVRVAQRGGKCVVIERDALGGTCLNWGCIPSKSLIRSADVYRSIKKASEFGIEIKGEIHVDLAAIIGQKDKIVAGLVKGIGYPSCRKKGVDPARKAVLYPAPKIPFPSRTSP